MAQLGDVCEQNAGAASPSPSRSPPTVLAAGLYNWRMKEFDAKALLKAAEDAAKNSYVPYSNEPKGAAILCSDRTVYTSGSVEFATFGGSVCAELAALMKAVNDGKRQFVAVALHPYRYPCGNCRQFLSEFGLELNVITARSHDAIESKTLPELLPNSFGKSNLG